jgi:hypothetical protein
MPTGSCACGAVRYDVSTPFIEMHHCHCSKCRKSHGAAFATFASTRADGVRITHGADVLREFRSSPVVVRRFCGTCGANVFFAATPFPDLLWLAAGTLDGEPGIRPGAHAFIASRAAWYEPSDALPSFDGYPPPPTSAGD